MFVSFLKKRASLVSDRQRRGDEDRLPGAPRDLLGPDELHRRLAEPAVREDRIPPLPQRPRDEFTLEVVEEVGQRLGIEPREPAGLRLPTEERFVPCLHHASRTPGPVRDAEEL
jgi:hypothetical protein